MSQVYRMAESATGKARVVVTLFRRMARTAMLGRGQSVLTSPSQRGVTGGWPKRGFVGVVADFAVRQKVVPKSAAKTCSRVS
jgi:hypothetical protein